MKRKCFILLLSLIGVLTAAAAPSVRISVSPSRGKSQIEVGDHFYLNIQVSNSDGAPSKPTLQGAKLMYFDRTSESSSFSSINGVTTQTYSATYTGTYRATTAGTYSFGPITVGGTRSNAVHYTIVAKGAGGQQPQAPAHSAVPGNVPDDDSKPKFIGKGDGNLFLRASVSSSTAYEQQALVYTVKLYTTYDAIKFVGATAAPKFDGFVVEESKDISSSLSYETYQGKTYATAVIARYIVFPQMTGSLKVTGNTYTISVDRREYYHDSFWGSMSFSTPMQLNVTPNDLVVNVKALPAPKPADFSGAVGKFAITSQLKTSQFKTNQAASIVYTVKGTGNIKYVQLPDLSALYPPEIEVYTPKATQNITVGGSNVSGSVSFDYSFMPLEEGEYRIPDVKLVYFNPATGRYETSVAKGYSISVGKGAASKGGEVRRTRFDAELMEVDASGLDKEHVPYVRRFAYWLWYIVPVLLLAAAGIGYRHYRRTHADMVAFNSKRANKMARRRLRRAAAAMKRHDADAFYDELLTAMWGYLGDKLKMPTSELMRDNVRQVLESRGVAQEISDRFIGIIDSAEFAKYSSAGGDEDLRKAYDEAADMIDRIERAFSK